MVKITEKNIQAITSRVRLGAKLALLFTGARLPNDITDGRAYPVLSVSQHDGEEKLEFLDDAGDAVATCVHRLEAAGAHITWATAGQTTLDDAQVRLWANEDNLAKFYAVQMAYKLYTEEYTPQLGDVVQWKDTMKDRKVPQYNEPAVIVEVLDEPLNGYEDKDVNFAQMYATCYYDIVIGIMEDGEFFTYLADSRRFEKHVPAVSTLHTQQ